MDKKHHFKNFFQKPVFQVAGKAASSGLVEALIQADGIASLVPVPGLKLALQSLLALIQAVDVCRLLKMPFIREYSWF